MATMNTKDQVLAALKTTDKTGIVPAINELKTDLDKAETAIAAIATVTAATPKFTISTAEPTDDDGEDGDVWFVYEEPAEEPKTEGGA